jgi:hypothetical protein
LGGIYDLSKQFRKERELTVVRWIAGLMGAAFLLIVLSRILGGEVTYGLHDGSGRPGGGDHVASVTLRTPLGLLLAFGSFGMMGAGALLFALVPRAFKGGTLVVVFLGVILASFAGLALIR